MRMSKIKQLKPLMSVILVFLMTASLIVGGNCVSAAKYAGRGTKSDPYLVETAEQLQGMKDNLSAHYKLNNTIDLSGMAFTPIGHEGTPFKGSFVCDTGSDGLPKYAIKNLSVTIIGVEKYANYVERKNKWQSALFGATDNATVTNIALLNVNIKNTIEGENVMNPDWSINPGMDSMATAALIGIAEKTTVTGCLATGTIDSRSNQTAGLVGRAMKSVISKCYTSVTIKQTGRWGNGGFVGYLLDGSKATECFSESDFLSSESSSVGFDAGKNTTGGFIGGSSDNSVIENCYSTGKVGDDGESFIGSEGNPTVKNCFSTGTVANATSVVAGNNSNNCFILNKSGCVQDDFKAASMSEIKAAFSKNNLWDTSGEMPQLKNVKKITDASKYVPVAGGTSDTTADNSAQIDNGGDVTENEIGAETNTAKKMTAEEFSTWVEGTLTKLKEGILTREEAFEAIKANDIKGEMDSDELTKLAEISPDINEKISDLLKKAKVFLVSSVTNDIDSLPNPDELTEKDIESVLNLYADFEKLPDDYKNAINEDAVKKLEECYEKAYEMQYVSAINRESNGNELRTLEIIICSVFGLLDLAAVFGVVYMLFRLKPFLAKNRKVKKIEHFKKTEI